MKKILIDSKDNIKYEGSDAGKLLKILLKEPENVTEEDEVQFEKEMRSISWTGELRLEVHFDLRFEGIDDWYRPVFKDTTTNYRFGSTNKLFTYEEWKKDGLAYFRQNPQMLEYLGTSFNCEPNGSTDEKWKFNIIG